METVNKNDRVRDVLHVVAIRDDDRLPVIVLHHGEAVEVVVEPGDRKLALLAETHDSLPDLVRRAPVDFERDLVRLARGAVCSPP